MEGRTYYIAPKSPLMMTTSTPLSVKSSPIIYPINDAGQVRSTSSVSNSSSHVDINSKSAFSRPQVKSKGNPSPKGEQRSTPSSPMYASSIQPSPVIINLSDSGQIPLFALSDSLVEREQRPRGRSSSSGGSVTSSIAEELRSLNNSAEFLHRPLARTLSFNNESLLQV